MTCLVGGVLEGEGEVEVGGGGVGGNSLLGVRYTIALLKSVNKELHIYCTFLELNKALRF